MKTESRTIFRPLVGTIWLASLIGLVLVPVHADPFLRGFDSLGEAISERMSIGELALAFMPGILVSGLLGMLAVLIGAGFRGAGGALVYILGYERLDDPRTARALTQWAQATIAAGLLVGVLGFLGLVLLLDGVVEGGASPRRVADAVQTALTAPIGGLLVGRVFLGSCADASRRAAGMDGAAFSLGSDFALLALLVPPMLVTVFVFTPWNV